MRCFSVLFFFVFHFLVSAQEEKQQFTYQNTPLTEVLSDIESRFQVKFSYNSAAIQDSSISLSLKNASLPELIAAIEHHLKIAFEQITERYYILKNATRTTVCGYLKDAIDGSPISDASVQSTTDTKGVSSAQNGYFRIENVQIPDSIQVSFIGFKTIKIAVQDTGNGRCDTYTLLSENYELNEVVVQEYLASGMSKTKDGAVKIKPDHLDILAGLSEPDLLQNTQLLPGIESPSETASGLYIRGGSPDQNLILWDGIKMYNNDHFFGMFSAFNPYIIKEVNVYRSGAKSEYGDRVSGVIDIKTDQKIPKKTTGGGGINFTHADGYLKVPLNSKIGLFASARRSFTDVWQTPTFNAFSKRVFQNTRIMQNQAEFDPELTSKKELFFFIDMTGKVIVVPTEKDHISLSYLYTVNRLDYEFTTDDINESTSDELNVVNSGFNGTWKRHWTSRFSSIAKLYHTDYNFDYKGERQIFDSESDITKTNTIKELGLTLHTDRALKKNLTFSNGYQFFSNKVAFSLDDTSFSQGDSSENTAHSVYSQISYDTPEKLHLDVGVRANYYGFVGRFYIEPRIYAERKLTPHARLKASAELRTQSISQLIEFQTYEFGLENQVWILAGEDIPVLRSNQFSTGFLYTDQGWNIDIDVYYKKIDGFTSLTRGFLSQEEGVSVGKSTTKGIDVLVKKKLNRYATWLGYTYSTTDFLFDTLNQGQDFKGNNDITHSLTWSHYYRYKNLQFSLGWKYRTGIPYTRAFGLLGEPDNITFDYGPANAERLPDYHRLDISVSYDFNMSKNNQDVKGKFGFSLLNLYGRKNILNRSYDIAFSDRNDLSFDLREVDKISLGVTPNMFFRVAF